MCLGPSRSTSLIPFLSTGSKDALFSIHPDKSLGSDGMNPRFLLSLLGYSWRSDYLFLLECVADRLPPLFRAYSIHLPDLNITSP